jgi:amino acid transporter
MSIFDALLGRPLKTSEQEEQKIGWFAGIPFLGLDALGSAAYGPEAALTILIPLGAVGLAYELPIAIVILTMLGILFLSYRQTISAYPNGGGSYTVAKTNLGIIPGLLAAAALMLDYVLDVAVGISAGVGALVSAVPSMHPHMLSLCLAILAVLVLLNLRGVKETGLAFAFPTYAFIISLCGVVAVGLIKSLITHGHPVPVIAPPTLSKSTEVVGIWLILRAFASGCTAMTGVEAVSNGTQNFRKPVVAEAQKTLGAICGLLGALLLGIGILCRTYNVGATDPDSAAYQSVLSQLIAAIAGRGFIYFFTIATILAVLALSANTGFADFPRLCHLMADDGYMPRLFGLRGRRLVYTTGIVVLGIVAAMLLIAFGGVTDRLIPLFAIGAFLAFTLSQAGMVVHWAREKGPHSRSHQLMNGVGAVCTAIALVIVVAAKFMDGAWITVILMAILMIVFLRVNHHYKSVGEAVRLDRPMLFETRESPLVVVPIRDWNRIAEQALNFALRISDDIIALHIQIDDEATCRLEQEWARIVTSPCEECHMPVPRLMVVHSPYRKLLGPILEIISEERKKHSNRPVAIIIPELQESKWYQVLLHNHRATALKAGLLFMGDDRTVVINVPWHLDRSGDPVSVNPTPSESAPVP